jgi:hypothetical protein
MKSLLAGDRRKTKRLSKRAARANKGSISEIRSVMVQNGKRNRFLYNLLQ